MYSCIQFSILFFLEIIFKFCSCKVRLGRWLRPTVPSHVRAFLWRVGVHAALLASVPVPSAQQRCVRMMGGWTKKAETGIKNWREIWNSKSFFTNIFNVYQITQQLSTEIKIFFLIKIIFQFCQFWIWPNILACFDQFLHHFQINPVKMCTFYFHISLSKPNKIPRMNV